MTSVAFSFRFNRLIAPIIPPSIAYIIFAVATNLSITQLFMAGIVPGIMMGL